MVGPAGPVCERARGGEREVEALGRDLRREGDGAPGDGGRVPGVEDGEADGVEEGEGEEEAGEGAEEDAEGDAAEAGGAVGLRVGNLGLMLQRRRGRRGGWGLGGHGLRVERLGGGRPRAERGDGEQ